jgi:hypothetical protein
MAPPDQLGSAGYELSRNEKKRRLKQGGFNVRSIVPRTSDQLVLDMRKGRYFMGRATDR